MIKFMMKSFLLITILLFGVLLGMQQANEGLKKMKGYEDPSFQGAFNIAQTESGELEASVLGSKVTSHDVEGKQTKLEEIEAFNLFSSIGKKFANTVSLLFEKIMNMIVLGIDKIIGGG